MLGWRRLAGLASVCGRRRVGVTFLRRHGEVLSRFLLVQRVVWRLQFGWNQMTLRTAETRGAIEGPTKLTMSLAGPRRAWNWEGGFGHWQETGTGPGRCECALLSLKEGWSLRDSSNSLRRQVIAVVRSWASVRSRGGGLFGARRECLDHGAIEYVREGGIEFKGW